MKHVLISIILFLLCISNAPIAMQQQRDYVIVLHGIARSSNHMQKMAQYLQQQGYDVINLNYPSTQYSLQELTRLMQKEITLKLITDKPVHFVGYSMGGLLARAIIHNDRPKNLGRVVQLASPNKGSEVADFWKGHWLYQKIYGPAGQQLITEQSEIIELLGEVNYELGIIAGNSTIDPISSSMIPGDDDGKVSVESTKVPGMKDHIIVSSSHTFFPTNKIVQQQTAHFLKYGVFNKDNQY